MPVVPTYPNLDMKYVQRQILADKPRVTKFPIPWGKEQQQQNQQQQEGDGSNKHEFGVGAGTPETATSSSGISSGSPMQMD